LLGRKAAALLGPRGAVESANEPDTCTFQTGLSGLTRLQDSPKGFRKRCGVILFILKILLILSLITRAAALTVQR
jgi:hypothetical protein